MSRRLALPGALAIAAAAAITAGPAAVATEPWKDRIVKVISAGRAMGRITDQKVRKTDAPSRRAASSMVTGTLSKNCFMMKTPAASTSSGRIIAA